ncbi:ADP-ribosylglycohydrolase family protein [Streptomyces violaceusniger]|uniref:ADP-ribosylglycohydrolase family protein n=1 Tax=Streptomyces violaceusniger TaxID=68280 RepID=UPI0009988D7F|nr:Hydrolase [Streptomyces hygroscopicus]
MAPPFSPQRSHTPSVKGLTPFDFDEQHIDRAAGVLLGAGVGDALGVPYEIEPRLQYSDDTQMQVWVAEVAATGADLRSRAALEAIAMNFLGRIGSGADAGKRAGWVLQMARSAVSEAMDRASRVFAADTDRSAGNGSLRRTGIVALAYLEDASAMAEAATLVSSLTHADPECAEACVLWCSGIRTAVLSGTFDGVRDGLALLPENRRAVWGKRLDEAEANPPHYFQSEGVVAALQAAWSAVTRTPVPEHRPGDGTFPAQHFQYAIEAALCAGNDAGTVAAIAGALLGARWGRSGIPPRWEQAVNGGSNSTGPDLVRLAVATARGGCPSPGTSGSTGVAAAAPAAGSPASTSRSGAGRRYGLRRVDGDLLS